MPSPGEALFRDAMRALTMDDAFGVPPGLRRDIRDHRYRTDSEGFTLCFDSPQREQLLRLLFHWAECHNPDVCARLTALGIIPRGPDMETPRETRPAVVVPYTSPGVRQVRARRRRTSAQESLFALPRGGGNR